MTIINNPTGLDQDEIRQALMDDIARLRSHLTGAHVADASAILEQTEHVVARLDNGQYGVCERCENKIGMKRLAAFPRATICMDCAGSTP